MLHADQLLVGEACLAARRSVATTGIGAQERSQGPATHRQLVKVEQRPPVNEGPPARSGVAPRLRPGLQPGPRRGRRLDRQIDRRPLVHREKGEAHPRIDLDHRRVVHPRAVHPQEAPVPGHQNGLHPGIARDRLVHPPGE